MVRRRLVVVAVGALVLVGAGVGAFLATRSSAPGTLTRYRSAPRGLDPNPARELGWLPAEGTVLGDEVMVADNAVVSYEAVTGAKVWSYDRGKHYPVTIGEASVWVAAAWDDGTISALNSDGTVRWQTRPADLRHDSAGAVWVRYARVLVATKHRLVSLDASSGRHQWSAALPSGCSPRPSATATLHAVVVVGLNCSGDGPAFVGIDLATGKTRWTRPQWAADVQPLDADRVAILDVSSVIIVTGNSGTAQTVPFTGARLRYQEPMAICGDTIVLEDATPSPGGTEMAAASLTSRAELWRHTASTKQHIGGLAGCAGDRVYYLEEQRTGHNKWTYNLAIVDLHTGRQLASVAVPPAPRGPDGLPTEPILIRLRPPLVEIGYPTSSLEASGGNYPVVLLSTGAPN